MEGADTEYATQRIGAVILRGYLAFSADGAPKGAFISLPKSMGLEVAEGLVALRPIEAHEQILWNYSTHDVKWDMYKELDLQSPRDFLQQYPFTSMLSVLHSMRQDTIEFYYRMHMFNYILGTAPVLLRLYGEAYISLADFDFIERLQVQGPFQEFGSHVINFVRAIEKSEKKKLVLDFLMKKVREGNVQILFNFIYRIMSVIDVIHEERADAELEVVWKMFWRDFCDKSKGTHFGRCDLLETLELNLEDSL